MKKESEFDDIAAIIKKRAVKKAPAFEWQDLALRVINELNVPGFKRSSVFRICKVNNKQFVENCLNDTKELCKSGEKWKYFFKVASSKPDRDNNIITPSAS
jgi:hypothetical protein